MHRSHEGMPRFELTSSQLELLLALEACGTPARLALRTGRDLSGILRQLKAVSELVPVVAKVDGRWQLTRLGRELNQWTRASIAAQEALLHGVTRLDMGSTPDLAARFLTPRLPSLKAELGVERCLVHTAGADALEDAIAGGDVDLAVAFGRPASPSVRFKIAAHHPYLAVASPLLAIGNDVPHGLPFIHCREAVASWTTDRHEPAVAVQLSYADIASAREAVCNQQGWAILPGYSVRKEIERGELCELPALPRRSVPMSLWYAAEPHGRRRKVDAAVKWLLTNSAIPD